MPYLQGAYAAHGAARQSYPLGPPPYPGSVKLTPLSDSNPCTERGRDNWEDLCSGYRAANAAESQAFWTELTWVVGVIGGAGVVATLFYTARAANAAKKAAGLAELALTSLEQPRIFLESITPKDDANRISDTAIARGRIGFIHVYRFKNHGRTPAFLRYHKVGAYYRKTGSPDPIGGLFCSPTDFVLGADAISKPYKISIEMDGSELESARRGDGLIVFFGMVAYRDIFNAGHETFFCYEWEFDEHIWMFSASGLNSAT